MTLKFSKIGQNILKLKDGRKMKTENNDRENKENNDVKLIDGNKYWLGACFGKFSKKDNCFLLGNCYIDRFKTIYKDSEVE